MKYTLITLKKEEFEGEEGSTEIELKAVSIKQGFGGMLKGVDVNGNTRKYSLSEIEKIGEIEVLF